MAIQYHVEKYLWNVMKMNYVLILMKFPIDIIMIPSLLIHFDLVLYLGIRKICRVIKSTFPPSRERVNLQISNWMKMF